MLCGVAIQASFIVLSHAIHTKHLQAHCHAGWWVSVCALCMEPGLWTGRERSGSELHCWTHVSTVIPLCGSHTHCTLLNSLTNLNMDSFTDGLSDKSQCDPFCFLIPLNWLHLCDVNYCKVVVWHQAFYLPYLPAKSCYTAGIYWPPRVEKTRQ